MNRILRPTLSMRALRNCFVVALALFYGVAFGQTDNCPARVINIVAGDGMPVDACSADLTLDVSALPVASLWGSTGATTAGPMLPIAMLNGSNFSYGVSQITIDTLGAGTCDIILVVSEVAEIPLDICDDVTVDIAPSCMAELVLPDDVVLTDIQDCEPGTVAISYNGMGEKTLLVTSMDVGMPTGHSVFVSKSGNLATCTKTVTAEDSTVPVLTCPSDLTVQVAPTCQFFYTYDVEGSAVPPCGGTVDQFSGDPSATPLGVGMYTYSFQLTDMNGSTVFAAGAEPCSWTVTVEESAEAGAQMNCVGQLNISIDQVCQAVLDAPTMLAGSLCLDPSLLLLSASIPGSADLGPAATITFTEEHVGMDIDVTVQDPNGVNSCWGTVTIEDKLAPIITCPADMTISCTMPSDTSATGIPVLEPVMGGNFDAATITNGFCEAELFFRDAVLNNLCNGNFQSVISRTFYAVDAAGNMSTPCVQTISVEREMLSSATFPEHYDGIDVHTGINDNGVGSNPPLACDGAGTEWAIDTLENGRIVPSPYDEGSVPGTGAPGDVGSCGTIFAFYEDLLIDICDETCTQSDASFKVLRTWDVFDWCTGESAIHEQIIKVVDSVAPVFTVPVPDLTVSTDLWGCGATIYLPTVEATDNCSEEISYAWSVNGGSYDPVANTVYVPAEALTELGMEVEIYAQAFDCCGNVAIDTGLVTIRDNVPPIAVADEHTVITLNNQEDDGSTKIHVESFDDGSFDGCGPIDWWIRRIENACENYDGVDADGEDDPNEIDELNDFHKYVHFCCEDVEEDQMVEFLVCDDADRDGTPEMNGDDNCNSVMVLVDVQDKLAPTIVCPPTATINCIDFVVFEDFINTELSDDQMEFLNVQFGVAYSNSTCGELGVQTFTGDDFCGVGDAVRTFVVESSTGQATCTQDIEIVVELENVLSCDRISFPTLSAAPYNYNWCDPTDVVSPFVTPVIVEECGEVNIESPVIDIDNLCTEVGINLTLDTFNFAGGACMKILAHWEVIDQCLFEENFFSDSDEVDPFVNENGYYEIYVEYDIFDTEGPEMTCEDQEVATTDCVRNYDSFSISATDDCTAPDIISYTFKVDLGADGEFDYPADGSYAEGQTFDASIDAIGGLEIGTHVIKWIAYDGCGNYSTCHQEIIVGKQDKAPTPYCHLGLSSAVMDEQYGCSVEFWATDFVAGGFDDCDANLNYLMIPYQDIFGDPADLEDDLSVEESLNMAMANWTFGCDYIENGVSHVVELRIFTIDEDGRYDFCDASLTLNDNFDCCEDLLGGLSSIAGNVTTDEGAFMEDVDINLMSNSPEFPRIQSTSAEGSYMFANLPYEANYEITASNNEGTKQGVSTLDLVLIQRHILGITPLDSPYKIIAADINGNEAISAADLLQLRKLILGLYADDKLPNNESWRFVDNAFSFVDAAQPFPFDEMVNVNELSYAMYNQNFIGVKIGDVNGSYTGLVTGDAQVRSANNFEIGITDLAFKAGETVSVEVTAENIDAIFGFQSTLEFGSTISYDGVTAGSFELTAANVNAKANALAISWNAAELVSVNAGDVLFTINFKAIKDGKLSQSISLSDKLITSEAYENNLVAEGINVTFRTIEDEDFALLQNEPNPFNTNTSISFVLPEEGNASLKVYDVTGKVILSKNQNFAKGLNTVIVNEKELGASGVLYYQVTYGSNSATRKMILLD